MLRKAIRTTAILILCSVTPIVSSSCAHVQREKESMVQLCTIDALMEGVYDGSFSIPEVKRLGNLGIGTFDHLDGEMILLDGICYKAQASGLVSRVNDSETTPFATVVRFRPDRVVTIGDTSSFKSFCAELDKQLPSANLFYALRIPCVLDSLKIRTVPSQTKPYPRLAQVVEKQSIFERKNVSGTLLGFRCPEYARGLNVPGYHLHFLSDDKSLGGHVQDFSGKEFRVQVDDIAEIRVVLPDDKAFLGADLSTHKAEELQKVEK
ncbi:MAG: acetolactate decarboxylase [Candidatus Hydrogenedentes bacterium]|nr:acetolactate decarboxylase [Candidatus Hydrogenedentota bacterium]